MARRAFEFRSQWCLRVLLAGLTNVIPVWGSLLRTAAPSSRNRIDRVSKSASSYRQRLDNFMNMQYYGDISIGDQMVSAIFDTGSFDLIVASTRCKQCRRPPYNPRASKTFKPGNESEPVKHVFGSGPVVSELGYEDVKVGPLTSSSQVFYQIIEHDMEVLENASFDAIVGLAPEGHNVTDAPLLKNFQVSEFSLCLEAAPLAPGWLTWGGDLSLEQKASSAAALPVVGLHHWVVSLQSVMPAMTLSKDQTAAAETLFCGKGCAAILDSGTSLITAPEYALRGLEILLPTLYENCTNYGDLPDIELVLGGHRVTLPPEAYVVRLRGTSKEKEHAGNFLHFLSKPSDEEQCVYGFMQMNAHTDFGPLWIFGMPFFRLYHTTFSNAPHPADRRIFLMGASEDCSPQPANFERITDASISDPRYKGEVGVFPKMTVLNARSSDQLSRRRNKEPMTLEARDLRPPPTLELL